MYYLTIMAGVAVLVLLLALVQTSHELHKVTDERDTLSGLLEAQRETATILDDVDTMSVDAVTIWLRDNDAFADQGSDVPSVDGDKTTHD